MADGGGHENRSSQEEDHRAARGYQILNRRQIHHQSYRILDVPWLKIVR